MDNCPPSPEETMDTCPPLQPGWAQGSGDQLTEPPASRCWPLSCCQESDPHLALNNASFDSPQCADPVQDATMSPAGREKTN